MNLKSEISSLKSLWGWVRQVSGDAAYENYLRSRSEWDKEDTGAHGEGSGAARKHTNGYEHGAERLLSREEFYLDALRRKYTGISRCC